MYIKIEEFGWILKGCTYLILVVFLLFSSCKNQETLEPEPSGKTITKIADLDNYILLTSLDPVQNKLYFAVHNKGISEIYLFDLVSQNIEFKAAADGQISSLVVSNDETHLAFSIIIDKIYLTNVSTNDTQTLVESNNEIIALEFSPNQDFLLFGEFDNQGFLSIYRLNLLDNETLKLVEGNIHYMGLTNENKLLIYDYSQKFYLIDWNGNQLNLNNTDLIADFLSEDGTSLLCKKFESRGTRIYTYSFLTNMLEYIMTTPEAIDLAGYSVDKNHFVIRTNRDNPATTTELYIVDKFGENMERLTYDIDYNEEVIGFYENDSKILFTTEKDGNTGLYSIDLE